MLEVRSVEFDTIYKGETRNVHKSALDQFNEMVAKKEAEGLMIHVISIVPREQPYRDRILTFFYYEKERP